MSDPAPATPSSSFHSAEAGSGLLSSWASPQRPSQASVSAAPGPGSTADDLASLDDRFESATGTFADQSESLLGLGSHGGPSEASILNSQPYHAPPPAAPAPAKSTEALGLALFVASTLFGTAMSACAKLLTATGMSVFEVVLFRSLALLAVTTPSLLRRRLNPFADPATRWLFVLRGALGFGSVSTLYMAVTLLPMADANVLAFLAPLWAAALSPLLLGERPSRGLVAALPLCIAGVLLVAQPPVWPFPRSPLSGRDASVAGVLVGVVQSVFSATAKMTVRALSSQRTESLSAIIFSMGAVSTAGSLAALAALRSWVAPRGAWTWSLLLANGALGYGNQVTQTAALQRARAAPAIAMSYLSVIWGILADLFLFHDLPNAMALLGAALICCSSLGVALWERQAAARSSARHLRSLSSKRRAELGLEAGAAEAGALRGWGASQAEEALAEARQPLLAYDLSVERRTMRSLSRGGVAGARVPPSLADAVSPRSEPLGVPEPRVVVDPPLKGDSDSSSAGKWFWQR